MIKLITYAPALGQPSASPFCVKAIWLLNMAGVSWGREDTFDPRSMPKQKLPAIRTGDQLIHDSDNIRAHLETLGHDFDAGLSEFDRATSRAFIRMAEEHIYFHIVMDRWGTDAVWPAIRDTYFHMVPRLLRNFVTGKIRKGVIAGMKMQGLGRLTPQERLARIEPDLQAIATRLRAQCFLFGDRPTAADASIAPMLAAIRATPHPTPLQERIAGDAELSAYIDRMEAAMRNPNGASLSLCA